MSQVPKPLEALLAPNRHLQWLNTPSVVGPESGIGAPSTLLGQLGAGRNTWFVDSSTGSDDDDGRDPARPLATIQAALDVVGSGDTILVSPGSAYTETLSTPTYGVNNVALIGLAPNGYRVTIAAADNDLPVLDMRSNEWRVSGFTFVNPTGVAAATAGAIRLNMDQASPVAGDSFSPDTLIDNCLFVGAGIGINFIGAPYWCTIQDCEFFVCTVAITCGASPVAIPFRCRVMRNIFHNNDADIDMAHFAARGFNSSLLQGNYLFANAGASATRIDLTGGRQNLVVGNYLDDAADAAAYVGGTDDMWNNWTDDAAAQPEPGVP